MDSSIPQNYFLLYSRLCLLGRTQYNYPGKAELALLARWYLHWMGPAIAAIPVHIALPRTSRNPTLDYPPLKVYRFSGESLTGGIKTHKIDGVEVKIYNHTKTIADCFKFRNQIGQDIAIEALKTGIKDKKTSYEAIRTYAEICRVKTVMKPYIETIAHG